MQKKCRRNSKEDVGNVGEEGGKKNDFRTGAPKKAKNLKNKQLVIK